MIIRQCQLSDLVQQVSAASWAALDTEADSLYSYPERLCLLQISIPGADELVDPLAGLDLSPLMRILERRELIVHGGDFDLRLLRRNLNFSPRVVFDTMLAARLLGVPELSLTDLAKRFLGETLEKGPQKANWSRRPLTKRMEDYARNDTRHLKPLCELLTEQLRLQGRLSWHAETCERLIQECAEWHPRDPDRSWRVKGSDRVSRRSLGILRELWDWREQEAQHTHKPPYFVLSHEVMIDAAQAAGEGREVSLPHHLTPRRREEILRAICRGQELPATELPQHIRHKQARMTEQEQRCYHELRLRRDTAAKRLHLDPALIASRTLLVGVATKGNHHPADLMKWQKQLLGLEV